MSRIINNDISADRITISLIKYTEETQSLRLLLFKLEKFNALWPYFVLILVLYRDALLHQQSCFSLLSCLLLLLLFILFEGNVCLG